MSLNGKPIFFYDNLLKKYAITVTSEASGYPKGNLCDDDLNSLWKATTSADQIIRIDAGAAVPVDIFCLGSIHTLATVSATVALQYSTTGAWAGEEVNAFTPFDPASDNSYQHKLFTQVSARYWQIKLSGMSGTPQIGEVAFGARYTLPRWFAEGFDDLEREISRKVNVADGGQKETVKFYKRKVFPCGIKNVAVGVQAETDLIAWKEAVEDGMPFWLLYDLRGIYVPVFVSVQEDNIKAPISGSMRREFSFTLEEEL